MRLVRGQEISLFRVQAVIVGTISNRAGTN